MLFTDVAARKREDAPIELLERGRGYVLVQPRVDSPVIRRLADVQRTFLLLRADGDARYRRILLGHKRLPRAGGRRERFWCFIDRIGELPTALDGLEPHTYFTQTRGERFQPGARLIAIARYAIARHGAHTHLAFCVDAQTEDGTCEMVALPRRGSFLLLAMRPPLGQRGSQQWHQLPEDLRAHFGDRRFAEPIPALLQREGTNLVFIPVQRSPRIELGGGGFSSMDSCVTAVPQTPDLRLALELGLPQP